METSIKLQVGSNIKKYRRKCLYTQEKLSELTNIDYKYIQRLEGKHPPNIKVETIARIAKVLKVKPSDLVKLP